MPWGTYLMPPTVHVMPSTEDDEPYSGHISHPCCECQPVQGEKNKDGDQIYVHRHDS